MKNAILGGVLLILSVTLACEHAKKTTAEAAVRLADQAWANLEPDAKTLAPEEFRNLQESLNASHDALAKGDYEAALASAKDLPVKVKELTTAIQTKKDELTAQWKELNDTMPGLVSAVQARMDRLKKSHHLPPAAPADLASVKQSWEDSSTAFQSGQLFEALSKGSQAQSKLMALQKALGLKKG